MKTKPVTPYERLLTEIKDFCSRVAYRHTKLMWRYPKERLHEGWQLADLKERTAAAEQLGYDVVVRNADQGLEIYYVKKVPDVPYQWT